MIDLYRLAQRPEGVTSVEAAALWPRVTSRTVSGRLDQMHRSGRIQREPSGVRRMWRYRAQASVSWADAETAFRKRMRAETDGRLDAAKTRLKGWQAVDAENAAKRAKRVVFRVIDGRKVPVELCPSSHDTRYTVKRAPRGSLTVDPAAVPSIFGGIGHYGQTSSWAEAVAGK